MRGFLYAVASAVAALVVAGPAWAQLPFHRLPPGCEQEPDYHTWARVDYLVWWLQDAPLPVPLAASGAIGAPGTTVLYGQGAQEYGYFNGGRVTAGFWLDREGVLGVEVGGFLTETLAERFQLNDPSGSTAFGVPFSQDGTEALFASSSLGAPGSLNINNNIRLWGYHGDVLLTVIRASTCEVSLIGGFRYLDLKEDLELASTIAPVALTSVSANDLFRTRNQFYGGELGLRAIFHTPVLFLELAGKVAFGANQEQVNISGQTTTTTVILDALGSHAFAATTPGGILAQTTNIGQYERTAFAVVPEAQVRLGLEVSSHLKVSLGYEFLYLEDAVRPGNQIDRGVNGVNRPAFTFNASEFYAHGFSLGVELRY